METALEYSVGRVEYVVPLMLFGLGLALIARPMIRAPRALNVGAILLVLLALLLAFAAGTLGLGPDKPVRHGYFDPTSTRARRRRRRGALLGLHDSLPAPRGPDPGGPDAPVGDPAPEPG